MDTISLLRQLRTAIEPMIDGNFSKTDAKVLRKFERKFHRWARKEIDDMLEREWSAEIGNLYAVLTLAIAYMKITNR